MLQGKRCIQFMVSLLCTLLVVLSIPGCGQAAELNNMPDVNLEKKEFVEYDLVVVGSDPEGIAAAISSARNKLKTLLVDTRSEPGGLMTLGWLNSIDMNYGAGKEILNEGIFLEFYQRVGADSFDVDYALKAFKELMARETKLDVLMPVAGITPILEEGSGDRRVIKGIKVDTVDGKVVEFMAGAVIDATQDADLAAACEVPYTVGHSDIGRPDDLMAATLVFRLSNVSNLDWAVIYNYLNNKDKNPLSGCNRWSAWGFAEITQNYEPSNSRIGLRGLNIGRQMDGSVLINAMHIFGVDPMSPESRKNAKKVAIMELPRLVKFLRENIPGLKDAKLAGAAPELYIRESRHIRAEYTLTIDDVLENRDFYDRIAFGSYPVDIQPTKPGEQGVVVGNPRKYAVPFRSLVPQGIDNLLVVGRSAGFDSLAHGSARTIPVGMAAGQSAGVAAAMAVKEKRSFRDMAYSPRDMASVQERLKKQGMKLDPYSLENPLEGHPDYEALKFIRRLGLAVGGYYNQYGLDDEMAEQKFITTLSLTVKQIGGEVKYRPYLYPEANSLTVQDTAYMFCSYLGLKMGKDKAFAYLQEQGFWDENLLDRIDNNKGVVNTGVGYALIKDFVTWLKSGGPVLTEPAVQVPGGQDGEVKV